MKLLLEMLFFTVLILLAFASGNLITLLRTFLYVTLFAVAIGIVAALVSRKK